MHCWEDSLALLDELAESRACAPASSSGDPGLSGGSLNDALDCLVGLPQTFRGNS